MDLTETIWTWVVPEAEAPPSEPHFDALGQLLDSLTSTAQDNGLVIVAFAFEVNRPLVPGETLHLRLQCETVNPSGRPQSVWLSFSATSAADRTPVVVGTLRGGRPTDRDVYLGHRFEALK